LKILNIKTEGSLALTAVILVGAILLATGTLIVITSINTNRAASDFEKSQLAEMLQRDCLEETVYKFKTNTSYTGTVSFTNTIGSCQSIVTDTAGNATLKQLAITTNIQGFTTSRNYQVSVASYPYTIVR
jgi:hypothetical protein